MRLVKPNEKDVITADAEIAALERKLAALREQKRFLLNNMVTSAIRLPQFSPPRSSATASGNRNHQGD